MTIEDTLFKSMEILTNHHFGSNILKPEEYLQIVDSVNARKHDNCYDIGSQLMSEILNKGQEKTE